MVLLIGINYIFYHLLKAPTRVGRSLLDTVEGFKVFLAATEKDRLNMLNPPEKTPDLFEKYLPYALAFDIEQQWAEQFSDILSATAVGEGGPPTVRSWYSGPRVHFYDNRRFRYFLGSSSAVQSLHHPLRRGQVPASGGGGSSGGGGGGGGGGGW